MKNKGFTLIEMLIVITIIVLLAGMVFRMVAGIGKSNDIAKTRATIEKVANAIEEFRSIYGKYPPVSVYEDAGQPVRYEFPGPGTFNATSGGLITQILNGDRQHRIRWSSSAGDSNTGRIYTFGLLSFLLPRYYGAAEYGPIEFTGANPNGGTQTSDNGLTQWANFNKKVNSRPGDSDRDLAACRRIVPHLGGRIGDDNRPVQSGNNIGCVWVDYVYVSHINTGAKSGVITNRAYRVMDAWDRDLYYRSLPPYDSYRIWSAGPDGKSGTADDIVAGVY